MSKKVEFIGVEGEVKSKKADKSLKVLKKINEAKELDNYLTSKLTGVEKLTEEGPIVGTFYEEDFKFIVPFNEFVPESMLGDDIDLDSAQLIMHRRLNSPIDYKIVGVDEDNKIVVGSRLKAMQTKIDKFWFGENNDTGDYLINEGSLLEARVVTTAKGWLIVEALGIEQRIFAKDISHTRMWDVGKTYQTGDPVLVKVMKLDRNTRDHEVYPVLSIKDAYENPIDQMIDRFNIQDVHLGTVTMRDKNGIYVQLEGGVEVLCKAPKRGIAPVEGSTVSVVITNINKEQRRMFGVITHVSNNW